jgi:hypothetical protein
MTGRVFLIVVCVITLAWTGGASVLYVYRRDWPGLRQFLFKRGTGIYGAPKVFWAAIALVALVRVLV